MTLYPLKLNHIPIQLQVTVRFTINTALLLIHLWELLCCFQHKNDLVYVVRNEWMSKGMHAHINGRWKDGDKWHPVPTGIT